MTLPPTSYAPVDSRTIGGFCGLRSSSAKAVVPSPANNNAAANGRSRFQSLEWLPAHFIRLLLPAICTGRLKAAPTWHLAKIIAGRTPVGHSYSAAFHQVELRGYHSNPTPLKPPLGRSNRKFIAEHRQTAARLLPRGLVLDDVPVFRQHALLHAHDVSDDPCRRWPEAAEPPMENDEITRRRRNVVLVAQRRGQGLDQTKESVTARRNMCAVLDVARRPEALGGGIVALVEKGIKRVQDDLHAAVLAARYGWCGHGAS